MGNAVPYYMPLTKKFTCKWCGKETGMYKVDNKGRVICQECFEKYYK